MRVLRRYFVLAALLTLFIPFPATAQDQRCFPETNQCISGPIRTFWERNGGLAVFGFPITAQATEVVEGRTLQVQWFERDRLEIQADGSVTAGRLGAERLEQLGTPFQFGPNTPASPGCTTFPETGHTVCAPFLAYWQANGGLSRFGFPVTPAFTAELEGKYYTVQYFERRRFELHPEITADTVLLGLLGREVLNGRQGQPQPQPPAPTPAPAPPSLPTPPAVTPAPAPPANVPAPGPGDAGCGYNPGRGVAPDAPVKIVNIDDRAETVRLQNVSGNAVNLDGWRMCSITGPQEHRGIGGTLAPGETRDFVHQGGQIWSNSDPDPGALYNAQGQLISYWPEG